jgi:hypothetical protein
LPASHFGEVFCKRGGRVREDDLSPGTFLGHTLELDAFFPDELELHVISATAGPTLIGAIVLVSERNKARAEGRRALATRCLSLVQAGVGVIVVDVVTSQEGNVHDEMAALIVGEAEPFPGSPSIYAVAYRPLLRGDDPRIAVWPVELKVGESLPVLPLWLRNAEAPIRIDLDAAYVEACRKSLIA